MQRDSEIFAPLGMTESYLPATLFAFTIYHDAPAFGGDEYGDR